MENGVLMKWRKNINLTGFLCLYTATACLIFFILYIERKNIVYLLVLLLLLILLTIIIVTSFKTWNEYLYMDEEKIWIKRKEKLIEWKIEDVITCRIIAKPRWTILHKIEIMTKSNPKKLSFESNYVVKKKLLEITKGKDSWKIFHEAFKR